MKAHDVRRLNLCAKCDTIGFERAEPLDPAPGLVTVKGKLYHFGCLSRRRLLALSTDVLDTVRLSDVGAVTMRAILAEAARREQS